MASVEQFPGNWHFGVGGFYKTGLERRVTVPNVLKINDC